MDRSTKIYLIAETYTEDDYGVMQATETSRPVFAEKQSVTSSEWFEGGRNGLNPEFRFLMFAPEYKGEKILEYNGLRYAIYRTFTARNDVLELYVERKKGND